MGAELVVVDCAGTSAWDTKRENRLLAAKACALLNVEADFSSSRWPARFEEIRVHGRLVIVDAAHNGDSVAKFLEAAHMKFTSTEFTVVFGCGAEKEGLGDMVDAVRPFSENVVCVEAGSSFADRPLPPSKRGEPAQLLAARVGSKHASSVAAALSSSNGPVLVCGSVYVAGEAREWCIEEDPSCLPADDWAFTLRDDML